jgi:transaldolase
VSIDPADSTLKLFADGADRTSMLELYADPAIRGFTTNPTLMRQAGVTDFEWFARDLLELIPDRPISFEVLADDMVEMERQALKISAWGEHVYVKVPVTNTTGVTTLELVRRLAGDGLKVNVTAVMTPRQVEQVAEQLEGGPPALVSVFAGRIADSGRDPVPVMRDALQALRACPNCELVWASPREVLNVVQARDVGCHVITLTPDLLRRLPLLGKDLDQFSLETVQMFHRDATAAGYVL